MTLPAGWTTVKLGECSELIRGISFPASAKLANPTGDSIVCLRTSNVQNTIETDDVLHIARTYLKHDKQLIRRNDIVVSMSNSKELVGKTALSPVDLEHTAIGGFLAILRVRTIEPRFVQYLLRSSEVRQRLTASSSITTNIANLSSTTIRELNVPLPPLPEQRRIIYALDTHFTRLDAAVATLQRVRANLKRYRAAVLQAAVEGRLGAAIGAAKWEQVRLADIADVKGGLAKGKRRKSHERVRPVPYLRVANVQRGYLDLAEIKEIEATEAEIAQLQLRDGDVLFNEGGDRDKLGRGWVWRNQIAECIHQNHVFRARLTRQGADPRFVSWYGNSAGQKYFLREGKQTTNLASINLNVLKSLPIPLPPPAEQRRIVDAIDSALSICDATESVVGAAQRRIDRLRQSLLHLAFDGRLVRQDPGDEPAAVLLDRICAERATDSSSPKQKSPRSRR